MLSASTHMPAITVVSQRGAQVVGDELEAAHQVRLPAKYLAADRRMSTIGGQPGFGGAYALFGAQSVSGQFLVRALHSRRQSTCRGGLRCRIGTPAALHYAESVSTGDAEFVGIWVIVAPSGVSVQRRCVPMDSSR